MLVQQHATHQGERVSTQELVGGDVLGDAQLWHPPGGVPDMPATQQSARVAEAEVNHRRLFINTFGVETNTKTRAIRSLTLPELTRSMRLATSSVRQPSGTDAPGESSP